jgi:hypothetical protein
LEDLDIITKESVTILTVFCCERQIEDVSHRK